MAGEKPGIRSHQECAGDKPGHPSTQITSRSTRERMYLSIPLTVRRSTFLPKRSSRKYTSCMKLSNVACPSTNSTSTSTSLERVCSQREKDPNIPIRLTPYRVRIAGIAFRNFWNTGLLLFRCTITCVAKIISLRTSCLAMGIKKGMDTNPDPASR
jgi:hypothetical protein